MHPCHQYACDKCQQRFKHKKFLRLHLIQQHQTLSNSNNCLSRRFECDQCKRNYSRLSTLQMHKKTHHQQDSPAGPKFICDTCGKDSFKTKASLTSHIRFVHERRIEAICFVCEKTFVDKTRFKHHMKIHTGERPYSCDICKSFNSRATELLNLKKNRQ